MNHLEMWVMSLPGLFLTCMCVFYPSARAASWIGTPRKLGRDFSNWGFARREDPPHSLSFHGGRGREANVGPSGSGPPPLKRDNGV